MDICNFGKLCLSWLDVVVVIELVGWMLLGGDSVGMIVLLV